MTDRGNLIDLLNRSNVDYDANDPDVVVIQTNQPDTFVEFRFWPGNGVLSNVAVQDWSRVSSV